VNSFLQQKFEIILSGDDFESSFGVVAQPIFWNFSGFRFPKNLLFLLRMNSNDIIMDIVRGLQREKVWKENMKEIRIIVEKHLDGYIAYPIGIKGIIIGEGDTFEQALADVKSAIKFHLETFSEEAIDTTNILETYVAAVTI
jgi:predicted RNase H-like HicB family nuclease